MKKNNKITIKENGWTKEAPFLYEIDMKLVFVCTIIEFSITACIWFYVHQRQFTAYLYRHLVVHDCCSGARRTVLRPKLTTLALETCNVDTYFQYIIMIIIINTILDLI